MPDNMPQLLQTKDIDMIAEKVADILFAKMSLVYALPTTAYGSRYLAPKPPLSEEHDDPATELPNQDAGHGSQDGAG